MVSLESVVYSAVRQARKPLESTHSHRSRQHPPENVLVQETARCQVTLVQFPISPSDVLSNFCFLEISRTDFQNSFTGA